MFLKIVALILVACTSLQAYANEKKATGKKVTLFTIEPDVAKDMTNVVLSFNDEINAKELKLEAHGSFLQLKLPNTFVPQSGEFLDLDSPYFTKAVAFQSGANEGAVRIFVKGDAEEYIKASTADILGKKVIVTLDHKTLNSGDKVVALPSESVSKKSEEAAIFGSTSIDQTLQGKMKAVSIFCGVMLLGLLVFFFLKPFIRKKVKSFKGEKVATMETLAVHSLSPKQKLTLVKVGDEKILLGLSAEGISYIKTIEENQPSSMQVGQMLAQAQVSQQMHHAQRPAPQPSSVAPEAPVKTRPTPTTSRKPNTPRKAAKAVVKQRTAQDIVDSEGKSGGVKLQLSQTRAVSKKEDIPSAAVDDIKRMIRQKLKQMPQIS